MEKEDLQDRVRQILSLSPDIDKALAIIRRPTLTKGQSSLYNLVVKKLDTNDMIMFAEAKDIWLTKVCREVHNGIPYVYNYWKDRYEENGEVKYKGGLEPMTEQMITDRVLLWLTSNIGALVLKGYLKVIPMIEVKQLI